MTVARVCDEDGRRHFQGTFYVFTAIQCEISFPSRVYGNRMQLDGTDLDMSIISMTSIDVSGEIEVFFYNFLTVAKIFQMTTQPIPPCNFNVGKNPVMQFIPEINRK